MSFPVASESSSDETLLEGYFRGEAAAFDLFFRRHAPRVLAYGRKRGLSEIEAHDLVQDVFLKLHRKIDTYEHGRPALPWFFTLVHRACIDALRRHKRQPFGMPIESAAEVAAPLEQGQDDGLSDEVILALAALPADQQKVIGLRMNQDGTFKELAQESDQTEATLRKTYSRGIGRLKQALGLGSHKRGH